MGRSDTTDPITPAQALRYERDRYKAALEHIAYDGGCADSVTERLAHDALDLDQPWHRPTRDQ